MRKPRRNETGLVIIPPPEIRTEINMWRRVFKTYDSKITPHITILYPFIKEKVWDESRRDVVDGLKDIRPFQIKLRELSSFVRDESILWLKPEDGDNLIRINARMHGLFAEHILHPVLAYVPHLTLGSFVKIEDMLKARTTVQKQLKPLQFAVDRVIYAVFEDEGWRIHDTITLS
ncbi:MAG: 2'-5' RNA ligase family protein [candidate division WOR-3 bacterium]|nr:MAG: 2'-5' RNA ligase family protein [candidate division WOR-3 bacterium]